MSEKGKQKGHPNLVDKDGGVKFPEQARNRAGRYTGLNNALREIFNSEGFTRIPIEDVESFCGIKKDALLEALKKVPGFNPKFGVAVKVTNGYAAAMKLTRLAKSKNPNTAIKAIKEIADRTEGKPTQVVDARHTIENPLPITADIKGLPEETLKQIGAFFRNSQQQGLKE
jgi:hypothetical protein